MHSLMPLGTVVRFCLAFRVLRLGSFFGAIAVDGLSLLIARFIEAVGYLPIVVSVPALLGQVTGSEVDRRVAAGIWGAYMPAGTAVMMLVAPMFLGLMGSVGEVFGFKCPARWFIYYNYTSGELSH